MATCITCGAEIEGAQAVMSVFYCGACLNAQNIANATRNAAEMNQKAVKEAAELAAREANQRQEEALRAQQKIHEEFMDAMEQERRRAEAGAAAKESREKRQKQAEKQFNDAKLRCIWCKKPYTFRNDDGFFEYCSKVCAAKELEKENLAGYAKNAPANLVKKLCEAVANQEYLRAVLISEGLPELPPEASAKIGKILFCGLAGEPDSNRGLTLLRKAAEGGAIDAVMDVSAILADPAPAVAGEERKALQKLTDPYCKAEYPAIFKNTILSVHRYGTTSEKKRLPGMIDDYLNIDAHDQEIIHIAIAVLSDMPEAPPEVELFSFEDKTFAKYLSTPATEGNQPRLSSLLRQVKIGSLPLFPPAGIIKRPAVEEDLKLICRYAVVFLKFPPDSTEWKYGLGLMAYGLGKEEGFHGYDEIIVPELLWRSKIAGHKEQALQWHKDFAVTESRYRLLSLGFLAEYHLKNASEKSQKTAIVYAQDFMKLKRKDSLGLDLIHSGRVEHYSKVIKSFQKKIREAEEQAAMERAKEQRRILELRRQRKQDERKYDFQCFLNRCLPFLFAKPKPLPEFEYDIKQKRSK